MTHENGYRQTLKKLPLRSQKAQKSAKPAPERSQQQPVRESSSFEEYYREQEIFPSEEELQQCLETLRRPLPSVFRITESGRHFEYVRSRIEDNFLESLSAQCGEDGRESVMEKLAWYPQGFAYKLNAARSTIRNDRSLFQLHSFLVQHNRIGSINRQEEVSMVPVFLLDPRPGHAVIDMCASPGSKTAQIIDQMEARGTDEETRDKGILIANDCDLKRCWMLTHQLKRFGCAQMIITNHEAQSFPAVLKFDRVLCDVPCSGDGTLRKLPDLWRRWNAGAAQPLHRLQVEIAWRGLQILSPGGRMVYSTCSFNPLENEAVVAEMLRRGDGRVELDCSPTGGWFQSFSEVPPKRRRTVTETMFPPEIDREQLRKCIRLVPQDQNSGGFFIAVFQTTADVLSRRDGTTEDAKSVGEGDCSSEQTKDKLWGGAKLIANDPLIALSQKDDSATVESIANSLGLPASFVNRHMMFRASDIERARKVYYTNGSVRKLLENSLGTNFSSSPNLSTHKKLRAVFAGVRVLEYDPRRGAPCDFRLTLEGLHLILARMTRQVVELKEMDYRRLISDRTMSLDSFESAEANAKTAECDIGTIAFYAEGTDMRETVVALKGSGSLLPLVTPELLHILRTSFGIEEKGDDREIAHGGGDSRGDYSILQRDSVGN